MQSGTGLFLAFFLVASMAAAAGVQHVCAHALTAVATLGR